MQANKHGKLVGAALRLRKAWLLLVAILGQGRQLRGAGALIPNYSLACYNLLKRHIVDLERCLDEVARIALLDWDNRRRDSVSEWLAARYDLWQQAGFGLLDLGRVHEVETAVGRLGHRRIMDCPPYAQFILQGFEVGAAIRHPEYHLARDLALLYDLLLDAEALIIEASRQKKPQCSEHNQSLARMVILTCFNLLESFTSGLATTWLLENPNKATDIVYALQGKKPNGRDMSLRERFCVFPSLVSGKPKLDDSKAPIGELFGECKKRRDSFVHCEPGPNPTKWGYVKEEHFHEAGFATARKTVDLTCDAICLAWKTVHGTDKPSWLPRRDSRGRFPRVDVTLQPADVGSLENKPVT